MSILKHSSLLVLGALCSTPALALAAPAAEAAAPEATTAAPAPSALDPGSWMDGFRSVLSDNAVVVGERLLLGLLLFIGGWLVAKVISYAVYSLLCATTLDNKLADKLRLGLLLEGQEKKPGEKSDHLERFLSAIVFYVLMLLVIVGVLQFAGLSQAAGPIQGLVDTVVQALPLVGKAALILIVAYFGGLLLSKLVTRGLALLRVDARFAAMSAAPGEAAPRPFSENVGQVIFWLVMVVGLAGAFEALKISAISEPLHNAIDRIIGVIPSVGFAAIVLFAGYMFGKVVRVIVTNLLESVGLGRIAARLGIARFFGARGPSWVIGTMVMGFIFIQAAIAAFNQLGLVTLSGPLTAMMARFWLILPSLAVSALIVAIAVIGGRLLRGVVSASLRSLGFDRLLARLGVPTIAERSDRLGEPSELVGFLVQAGVVLLAVAQALDNLQLDTWSRYVNAFLGYLLTHVFVAMAIVLVGLAIGTYVRDVIAARQEPGSARWLPEFARYSVLVFAFTMALRQLEVAEDFVLLAFGLLFGGLCLAMAIAFGLGGKEVAGEVVRRRYQQLQSKTPPAGPSGPTGPTGPAPGGSGLFSRTPLDRG